MPPLTYTAYFIDPFKGSQIAKYETKNQIWQVIYQIHRCENTTTQTHALYNFSRQSPTRASGIPTLFGGLT
jgi:hypothetical protein